MLIYLYIFLPLVHWCVYALPGKIGGGSGSKAGSFGLENSPCLLDILDIFMSDHFIIEDKLRYPKCISN